MNSLLPILVGAVFVGLGFLLVAAGLRWAQGDEVSRRLHDFVSEPAPPAQRLAQVSPVRRSELAGSFRTRILQPWFKGLGGFFGRFMPARNIGHIDHLLSIAGRPLGLGAREFYGLRLVFALLGLWMAYLILGRGFELIHLSAAALALYVGVLGPTVWLRRSVRKRQDRVRKDLPDALDMLSVCAQAGLGFDQAMQRVSETWKTSLSVEFARVVAEMEMGVPRRQALRNLADRLDIPELSSFVAVIIQSDQLGMSIADTLQAQAEQMRVERRFRAQEAARKVPLKMLFPMILLIFPAMLAVVCGPSIPLIFDLFSAIRGGR
jgi:tight adherence protein C